MKENQNININIDILKSLELDIIKLTKDPEVWKTLDVDYFPPRVERLYTIFKDYRIFLHTIHKTNENCLFHKHRWPAAFKQLGGSYEMGITYSENEIDSDLAYKLPTLSKFIISAGNYYEMTQTDCLHYVKPITDYVKPITDVSYSIMITKDLYPESSFRKESLDRPLLELSEERKLELLLIFNKLLNGGKN